MSFRVVGSDEDAVWTVVDCAYSRRRTGVVSLLTSITSILSFSFFSLSLGYTRLSLD